MHPPRRSPATRERPTRLTKRPKVFWRDSGLLHALLNVPDRDTLLAQPWVGASWEGFVIEQTIGLLSATGRPFEAFYFRTSDRYALDLVLDLQGERWAIEVKLTSAPGPDDLRRLDQAADLIDADRRFLVSQTASPSGDEHRASLGQPG
jgi:predicted AAA+ superfamily ATPase